MAQTLPILSVYLHILAAVMWIGGMAALGWILVFDILVLATSAVHDFHFEPKAIRLMEEAPESPEAQRMSWWSSWLGRLTLLLSLIILWFAILLPRGGL